MESKILIISFLGVTSILFSGCRSQNLNNGFGNIERKDLKQCICEWNVNAGTNTVFDIINLFKHPTDVKTNYERQVIYLYKNLVENETIIHIPKRDKQKLIPDAPVEDDDVLITLTNETVNDLLLNYPEHVTLENAELRLQTIREKDSLPTKHKNPNHIYSYIPQPVWNFKPINPLDFKGNPVTSNPYDMHDKPFHFHAYSHNLNPSDTRPVYSDKEEPFVPINFSEDFWPDSHVSVPPSHNLHPNHIEPVYSDKEEPFGPINFSEDFWPGSHVSMPYSPNRNPNGVKPIYFDKEEPFVPINFSEDLWPGSHVTVPHPHNLNPSDIKPIYYNKDGPVKFTDHFWPGSHVSVSHPHNLNPSDIKPVYSDKEEPFVPINFSEDFWPGSHVSVPHSHNLHPSDIKPVNFDKQVIHPYYSLIKKPCYKCKPIKYYKIKINPYVIRDQYPEPANAMILPHLHPLHTSDINPVDSGGKEPVYSVEGPHSYPLHPSDIKPVYSGQQEPEYSIKFPHSYPLQSSNIKQVYSGEQEPKYSAKAPHSYPLYPSDIKPVYSDQQEPKYSVKVLHSHPLHPSDNKLVNSSEQEPKYSVKFPHSHPLRPSDIKPVYSGEQKPEYSIEVLDSLFPLHTSDTEAVYSGKHEPKYSVKVPHSHPLHPNDIKPVHSSKQEPEYSIEVPDAYPLHPSDTKPVYSGQQEPQYATEVPETHSYIMKLVDLNENKLNYPSDTKPVDSELGPGFFVEEPDSNLSDSGKQEPSQSMDEPDSRPSDIKLIDSGEQEPEYAIEVPDSNPLHPSDTKPVYSGQQKPEYAIRIPDLHSHPLHPSDSKQVYSDKQKPEYTIKVPDSQSLHTSDIVPIYSSQQKPEYTIEVSHSHRLHPSDIEPVYSGEPKYSIKVPHLYPLHQNNTKPVYSGKQEPKHSVKVPHSQFLHPSDNKPVFSGEQEPKYSVEVPNSYQLYPSDTEPVSSGQQEPEYATEVPDAHSDITKHVDFNENKLNHPSDTKPVDTEQGSGFSVDEPDSNLNDSGEQKPSQSVDEPDSHPSDIKLIDSGEQDPSQSVEEPDFHVSDISLVNSEEQASGYSVEVPDSYPSDPFTIDMGYKTFDEWFREEMHRFKKIKRNFNVYSVGSHILKILFENGMFVTKGGVLKDSEGKILYLQNLKLRPVLIGGSMGLDKIFTKDSNTHSDVSAWSELVILSTINPAKILGIIPLGKTYLPISSALNLLSLFKSQNDSKYRPKIAKKSNNEGQSLSYLSLQNVDGRYKRYLDSDDYGPIKITEPQKASNSDIKDGALKDEKGHDESVENFLKSMPHYSYRRKGYVNRQDLGRDEPLHLSDVLVENSNTPLKITKTNVQQKDRQLPKNPQNDDIVYNDLTTRIIGGSAATGSGVALNNKGRSGGPQKLLNHPSHNEDPRNHGSNVNFEKHDYVKNSKDLYHDDLLIRIIGGNAATGSGSPLSNKGRSGAPH